MSEIETLEDPSKAAHAEVTDNGSPFAQDAATVLERWWLTLAGNDYDRIQRAKEARSK